MQTTTYSDLREHLSERLNEIHESRSPLLVTRRNGAASVIVDKEEWDGLMATVHLLHSSENARRLLRSIESADAGAIVARDLDE